MKLLVNKLEYIGNSYTALALALSINPLGKIFTSIAYRNTTITAPKRVIRRFGEYEFYLASELLKANRKLAPKDGIRLILTSYRLEPEFGYGDDIHRICIVSNRFHVKDGVVARNSIETAPIIAHELGETLGLSHHPSLVTPKYEIHDYKCIMHPSVNSDEYCEKCLPKLERFIKD